MKVYVYSLGLVLLLLFSMPGHAHAWTAETCVCGPGDGVSGGPPSDNLSSTGQNRDDLWKAFRWRAGSSGQAYVFCARVAQVSNPSSSEDVAYAVYEDNNGSVGPLKLSGYVRNYNWNANGLGRHFFDLQTVHTNRTISAGAYYWITLRTSTSNANTLWFDRQSSDSLPSWVLKKFSTDNSTSDYSEPPPGGVTYNGTYDPNYYGWSVWSAAGGDNPPNPPTGIRIDAVILEEAQTEENLR